MTSIEVGWDSVIPLIELLKKAQEPRREELKRLLARSSELLQPLAEPLMVNNQLAVMLAKLREEAYSDWLGWSLEQLEPVRALQVLGLSMQFQGDAKIEAKREHYVASGRKGSSGRLDIRLCTQGRAIADVEVKLGDADSAITDKHEGYAKSGNAERVLIATSGARPFYGKFKLQTWHSVCVALRRGACALITDSGEESRNVLRAGWILQFVGAVEETLLKIPGATFRAICNRNEPVILADEGSDVEHLKKWIESEDIDG